MDTRDKIIRSARGLEFLDEDEPLLPGYFGVNPPTTFHFCKTRHALNLAKPLPRRHALNGWMQHAFSPETRVPIVLKWKHVLSRNRKNPENISAIRISWGRAFVQQGQCAVRTFKKLSAEVMEKCAV